MTYRMETTAPLEVGLSVRDLDTMIAFYRDILGLAFVSVHDMGPAQGKATALSPTGYRIARLQAPGGERVKLVQAKTEPDATLAGTGDDGDDGDDGGGGDGGGGILGRRGIVYLTFIITGLDAMIRHLSAHGVRLLTGEAKVEPRPGVLLAFAEDPEGNVIEFVEYLDLAAYRPDLHAGA